MKKSQEEKISNSAKGDPDKLQDLIKQQVKHPGSLHIFFICDSQLDIFHFVPG